MGPPPDNCQQEVSCSLLRPKNGCAYFEAGPVVWIQPPRRVEPLRYVERLLRRARLSDAEELRGKFKLPQGRWLLRELKPEELALAPGATLTRRTPFLQLELDFTGAGGAVLFCALVLGLCNLAFYAPDRPVVWTNQRLSRRLQLYRSHSFYAD